MKDFKFDKAYYESTCEEIELIDLIKCAKEDESEFIEKYSGHLYCPCCKKVQLSLVHRKTTFLRTYRGQKHGLFNGEKCDYDFQTASVKVVDKYLKNLENANELGTKLDAIIRRLLKQSIKGDKTEHKDKENIENPFIIQAETRKKTVTQKIIPRYSIRNWEIIPYDNYCLIYGKVCVKVYDYPADAGTKKLYLHLYDLKTNSLITSCNYVLRTRISNGNYIIALFAKKKHTLKDEKSYSNLRLYNGLEQSISISPLGE